MRLPGSPTAKDKIHFLTDFYVTDEFHLTTLPFNNSDENAFLKFYNMEPIRIEGTSACLM